MVVLVTIALLLVVGSIVAAQPLERRTTGPGDEERRRRVLRIAEERGRRGDPGRQELERRRRARAGE